MDYKGSLIPPDKLLERITDISRQFCVDIASIRTVTVETVKGRAAPFRNSSFLAEGNQECDVSDKPDDMFGLLVGSVKSSLRIDSSFCIVFEDETDQIPCCFLDILPMHFNQPVIITEWNYITSSHIQGYDGYIEICSLTPVKLCSSDHVYRQPAFSVSNARFFQHNREALKKELITVIGCVKAMSELLRLKDCYVFLVQLADLSAQDHCGTRNCITILVRDFKFLHWQTIIKPQHIYMFTDMRLTTLYPGEKTEEKVYICSNKSDLVFVDGVNVEKVEFINLKNYLKAKDVTDYEALCAKWQMSVESDSQPAQHNSFTCVEGTVSNDSCAKDGILELDGKMRLYLTHSSWQYQIRLLRVGTRISVYNAHFHVTAEVPKMRFFCCSYGCVKTNAFASSLPNPLITKARQGVICSCDSVILHLVREYGLSLGHLECVLDAQQILHSKLQPKVISCSDYVLLKLLTEDSSSSPAALPPLLRRRLRNPIAEFFDSQHAACQKEQKSFLVPSFEEISQFCQRLALKRSASSYNPTNQPTSSSVDVDSCWRSIVIASSEITVPWVIVGVLKVNRPRCRLQLVDQTGSIDCVVGSWLGGEDQTVMHQCEESECLKSGTDGVRCCCPYVQTSCLERVYRLDKFQLIVETFIGPNFTTIFRKYIQFSMLDALPLFDGPTSSCTVMGTDKPSSCSQQTPKTSAQMIAEVADKLRTTSCTDKNHRLLTIGAGLSPSSMAGSAVKSSDLRSREALMTSSCTCSVYRIFVVDYCESVTLKSRIPNQVSLCCSVSGRFVGAARIDECGCLPLEPVSLKHSLPLLVHVALNLQDFALKWVPVLHSGCVYRLIKRRCRDTGFFDGKPGYSSLMKPGLPKAAARLFLSLGNDVEVERMELPTLHDKGQLSMEEINAVQIFVEELLNRITTKPNAWQSQNDPKQNSLRGNNPCRDLVCISGVIVARSFGQPQGTSLPSWKPDANLEKLGVSMPVNVPVKLTIRDVSSPVQIDVYLDLDRLHYPLGLLVGATVRLERLERKVSQANRCYCRFLIVSSCSVLALGGSTVRDDVSQLVDLSSCSKIYLADLWNPGINSAATYLITGHVCLVSRIVLKVDRTRTPEMFMAQASFLIDDGTSTSFVSCSGTQVADLLDLDPTQWTALKDLVIPVGEVVYNFQMRPGKSSSRSCDQGQTDNATLVECFVHELCDSSIVRRSVTIVARRYRTMLRGIGEKCTDISNWRLTGQSSMLRGIGERYTDISNWRLTDFERKSVRKGAQSVDTAVLPSLQMDCIEFIKSRMVLNMPGKEAAVT